MPCFSLISEESFFTISNSLSNILYEIGSDKISSYSINNPINPNDQEFYEFHKKEASIISIRILKEMMNRHGFLGGKNMSIKFENHSNLGYIKKIKSIFLEQTLSKRYHTTSNFSYNEPKMFKYNSNIKQKGWILINIFIDKLRKKLFKKFYKLAFFCKKQTDQERFSLYRILRKTIEKNRFLNPTFENIFYCNLIHKSINFNIVQKVIEHGKSINIPCPNCPVLMECHPQGLINPFDCKYIK
mmetsp:Transcript_44925/g.70417  ORF Transcript_44925/g.70417 Transcript_44925/m.70417 type:complete len:243 (-) Transcript_44925:78-806(-)